MKASLFGVYLAFAQNMLDTENHSATRTPREVTAGHEEPVSQQCVSDSQSAPHYFLSAFHADSFPPGDYNMLYNSKFVATH
ncbi:hypothetical protein J6590_074281 [Homalodisca vitripennis]|nr:hypothetical protein J6590_074281 [Homalodisca vitripennis]